MLYEVNPIKLGVRIEDRNILSIFFWEVLFLSSVYDLGEQNVPNSPAVRVSTNDTTKAVRKSKVVGI